MFSQEVMLKLTQKGISRELAYRKVQKNAKKSIEKDINLLDLLISDKEVSKLISEKELKQIFFYKKHFKNINRIFKRVFG